MKAHKRCKATALDDLAVNLIFRRAQKRLSQAALAKQAGVARQTVSKLESGIGNVTIDVLARIADALQCPLAKLFEGFPEPGPVSERELLRRAKAPRSEFVDTLAFLDAIDEAKANGARYSRAGRPRRVAHRKQPRPKNPD